MSRHRKVKALDYDEEYDDFYNAYDDDDDFDEGAFESQYLSSGIDLDMKCESNNISKIKDKARQAIIDEVRSNSTTIESSSASNTPSLVDGNTSLNSKLAQENTIPSLLNDSTVSNSSLELQQKPFTVVDGITSDLTKIAIQHLDKHQWQLPLMEMDKKFRDKTYYMHYSDTYISSLRSKLGHFIADTQLISNPMKYHLQQELDNYSKYSRMFELLTDYYQSLGNAFFSFTTPSPDEEIVIGCRLGTKVKKPVPKQSQTVTTSDCYKARFEYHGKPNQAQQPSTSKANKTNATKPKSSLPVDALTSKKGQSRDVTIQEQFTAEHLDGLAKEYRESLDLKKSVKTKKATLTTSTTKSNGTNDNQNNPPSAAKKGATNNDNKNLVTNSSNQKLKQLVPLVEKRHNLKQHLKRLAEPSQQDKEAFKAQALKTAKEYDELAKCSRPRVNLVVVGHVDAGKSTLVGHLLFKLGQVSGKQMHRNEVDSQRSGKASFKFAWAMDETAEERARGVTIDIALTQFETPHRDIVLLDSPGHVDFIPAVISGAAQADAALLVVDATRGEFETGFSAGGQTREHTFLVRSLGVKSLVVVVNKMDNVDWSWDRFSDIVEQLKPFLKQVGFNLNDEVQFVVCSGLTGENLIERRIDKTLKQSSHPQLEGGGGNWSSVPSLLEAIDKIKQPERMVDKPTRVSITDVFKGMSSGVFLGGKVISGKLESKQKLLLLPPNESCEVKQVEIRGSKTNRAFAGDIVTTVASGIDMNKYYRGCMLCDPIIPCHVTNRFQARIIMFQGINTILIKGAPIEVHINGTFEGGQVRKLISLLNKQTAELIQNRPRCVAKNSSAIIQLKLDRVVCCELYEDNKDLGRFMMRSYGKTIAAGLITKIKSPKVEKSQRKLKSK